jgi:molecular chaperone DnaJ
LFATVSLYDIDFTVKVPEGVNNGEILRLKGKGVPFGRSSRGDLLIRLDIKMPSHLSKTARMAIENLKKEGI